MHKPEQSDHRFAATAETCNLSETRRHADGNQYHVGVYYGTRLVISFRYTISYPACHS
ncbi:hypothetical protein HanIR_Chr17g0900301 [Helianthus annuus]|nr:hypothetical protein HanIR_Chr17g0900301 [Helianthus annuus]